MMKLPNLTGFEGLIDLDRRGVDIRPILLRVLTDQYLHRRPNTPDEERQYTELALRLLDETDVSARAAVAARLAPQAGTPRPIILRLARDILAVAEPILRLSPQLTPADLAAIARERGSSYAAIIAQRALPQPSSRPEATAPLMALRHEPAPKLTPPPIEAKIHAIANTAATSAAIKPDAKAVELCELFFAAGPTERRLILISLEFLPTAPPALPSAMRRSDIWRLESAALQHKTEAVVHNLERALGVSRAQARRIVEDDLGEPIVAAAKAMELPPDVLQRMLLFMNPQVGQSVDRVYELAGLYADITADAARRLIAIWRDADPPDLQAPPHDALWQEAVEQARTALANITRRPPTRRETPAFRTHERAVGNDRR